MVQLFKVEVLRYAGLGVLGFTTISKVKVSLKQAHFQCPSLRENLILNPNPLMFELKNRVSSYQNRKIEIGKTKATQLTSKVFTALVSSSFVYPGDTNRHKLLHFQLIKLNLKALLFGKAGNHF